ncbi:kinase family protein [Striga asiatica]|uniref:non-specific serine/threonine protein kinase n=1 Tax=Striga asiatica TaxID=4170 RepID=A0A5A7QWW8_STRAF|nr:kinase family protein [Striga asiatica]
MGMGPQPGSGSANGNTNWVVGPPPPPPPMMSSSEMSSAGFSGPHQAPLPPPHPAMALGFNQSSFTYNDLAVATNNFAHTNLLGQGGFGFVHKGMLPNGKEIAVKSLKMNSGQGEREFQAEVDIISRVHHRHLVSLVGYCSSGTQRMLVYEYVPNGTLEFHLHGAGRRPMDWPTRLNIALGSAKGFAYLHEDCHPRIIHRDIKAANILLDFNFDAKVADFGLAKLSSDTNTHVSTRIMGTFGPILMSVTEGAEYDDLVDPKLGDNYDPQEMLRMVHCAAACIRHSARRRPKMSQIVRALEGDVSLDDLHEGIKSSRNGMLGSSGSSDYDLKRYDKKPGTPSSQDFTSSELGLRGEYAHSSDGNSQEIHRPNTGYRTYNL